MSPIKVSLLLCLASGLLMTLSAETALFETPVTRSSREILSLVCSRIASNPVVRGSFTQTKRINRLKKDFNATGKFLFSTTEGVLWNVEKPYPSTMVMTKDRLIQTARGGKTSIIEGNGNAVFKRFAGTLQAVFAGRLAVLEQDFDLYFQGSAKAWQVGLVPREETVKSVIQSMEISGDEFIRSLKLVEAGGDATLYRFQDSASSAELTAPELTQFANPATP